MIWSLKKGKRQRHSSPQRAPLSYWTFYFWRFTRSEEQKTSVDKLSKRCRTHVGPHHDSHIFFCPARFSSSIYLFAFRIDVLAPRIGGIDSSKPLGDYFRTFRQSVDLFLDASSSRPAWRLLFYRCASSQARLWHLCALSCAFQNEILNIRHFYGSGSNGQYSIILRCACVNLLLIKLKICSQNEHILFEGNFISFNGFCQRLFVLHENGLIMLVSYKPVCCSYRVLCWF